MYQGRGLDSTSVVKDSASIMVVICRKRPEVETEWLAPDSRRMVEFCVLLTFSRLNKTRIAVMVTIPAMPIIIITHKCLRENADRRLIVGSNEEKEGTGFLKVFLTLYRFFQGNSGQSN